MINSCFAENSKVKPIYLGYGVHAKVSEKEYNNLVHIVTGTIAEELTKRGFTLVEADDPTGEYVRENKLTINWGDLRNCFSRSDLKAIAKIAGSEYLAFYTITVNPDGKEFWTGAERVTYSAELRIVSTLEENYVYKKEIFKKGNLNNNVYREIGLELIANLK